MAKNVALAAYKAGARGTKTKHRRRSKGGISFALIAGLAPTAMWAYHGFKEQGAEEGVTRIIGRISGYSLTENKFQLDQLLKGWIPLLAGVMAHKYANRYGINRMLANAGIPFIRI